MIESNHDQDSENANRGQMRLRHPRKMEPLVTKRNPAMKVNLGAWEKSVEPMDAKLKPETWRM